jgi:hypothetical protein
MVSKKKTKKRAGDRSNACKFLEYLGEVSYSRQPLARCRIRKYTMGLNNMVCQVCMLYTPLVGTPVENLYKVEFVESPDEIDFDYLSEDEDEEYAGEVEIEEEGESETEIEFDDEDSGEKKSRKKSKSKKKSKNEEEEIETNDEEAEEEEGLDEEADTEEEAEEEEAEEEEDEDEIDDDEPLIGEEDLDESEVLVKGLMGEIEEEEQLELEDEAGVEKESEIEEEIEVEEEEEEEEELDEFEEELEEDEDEFGEELEDIDIDDDQPKAKATMAKKSKGLAGGTAAFDPSKDIMSQLNIKKDAEGNEICPFCMKTFQTLTRHLKTCKRTPQNVKDALEAQSSKKKK